MEPSVVIGRGGTLMGGGTELETGRRGRPVIIDCDPGVDDFLAIQLALNSPKLNVQAVTVTGGNCPLRLAVRNALRALDAAGRPDIPVHRGANRPLVGRFASAAAWHGKSGLTGRLPVSRTTPSATPAIEALARLLESSPAGSLTVIALGPLTNIALLIQRHWASARRIGRLVVMGGAVDVPGNVTPHAEFNIWDDAKAAQVVLRSGLPILLVGIDVCGQVRLKADDAADIVGPVGQVIRGWFSMRNRGDEMVMYDPVAVFAAMDESQFKWESTPIDVVQDGPERGRTIRVGDGPSIRIAVGVEAEHLGERIRSRILG